MFSNITQYVLHFEMISEGYYGSEDCGVFAPEKWNQKYLSDIQ